MAVADGITRFPVFGLSVHRAQIGSSLVTLWLADDAVSEQGARYCSFVVRMLSRLTSMYAAALPLDSCCQSNGRYGTVCSVGSHSVRPRNSLPAVGTMKNRTAGAG